jgi:starvation-inducible DNA-binding protein
MSSAAQRKPSLESNTVSIGVPENHRKLLADGLSQVLADSYTLLGKTHGFHWNVTGPEFPGLHEMFEHQYEDLQKAVDEIAERIRALGFLAPGSLTQFLKLTDIKDEEGAPDTEGMLRQLVNDNELASRACRKVVSSCEEVGDTSTEDLMNARITAHEKAAWMCRASLSA